MAELISIIRFNKYVFSGDFNKVNNGIYYYNLFDGSIVENSPGANYGFVIAISNGSMFAQIGLIANSENYVLARVNYGDGWTKWREL